MKGNQWYGAPGTSPAGALRPLSLAPVGLPSDGAACLATLWCGGQNSLPSSFSSHPTNKRQGSGHWKKCMLTFLLTRKEVTGHLDRLQRGHECPPAAPAAILALRTPRAALGTCSPSLCVTPFPLRLHLGPQPLKISLLLLAPSRFPFGHNQRRSRSHRAFQKGTEKVCFPLHQLTPERFHFYQFPMLGFPVSV